jgi:hypothetical protein
MVAFDFVPKPSDRGSIASTEAVLQEQVAAFYDPREDRIYLPDTTLKDKDEAFQQRAVLAHEITHALQDQHFPEVLKDRPSESSDASLARLALVEGDAQVSMGAAIGTEAGEPVGRTLRRIVEATKKVPLAAVTRGERRQNLDRALELTRKHLLFPYEEGTLFVSDVYRAGGFPLVDQLYKRPPESTEQILHPEKYLAGEAPRTVGDPSPPPGYKRVTVDTLGEFDTRTLLSRGLSADAAESAAAGWAGDRFGVFVGPNRHLALAWISAWDTEQDAREFESALAAHPELWHENALGLSTDDYVIGPEAHVQRKGERVVFVRGVSAAASERWMKGLFNLVGPEPPARPVTTLQAPPRVALPEPRKGRLDGDVYANDWLGLTGRVPPGMLTEVGGDIDLIVHRPDVAIWGGVGISLRVADPEQNEKTFDEVESAFAASASRFGGRTEATGSRSIRTLLGSGIERTWRLRGTSLEERAVLIPICASMGSIVFVQIYGDQYAKSVLDAWMESFRWLHGRNLTACDYLDPK